MAELDDRDEAEEGDPEGEEAKSRVREGDRNDAGDDEDSAYGSYSKSPAFFPFDASSGYQLDELWISWLMIGCREIDEIV